MEQSTKVCYVCEGREPTVHDELKGSICERHHRAKMRARLVAKQKESVKK